MVFDDDNILPEHNIVSSEWEKNQLIEKAYDNARATIVPKLIDLLETHVGVGVWEVSTILFRNPTPPELWNKPDCLVVHELPSLHDDNPCDASSSNIHGTMTQFFFEHQRQIHHKATDDRSSRRANKGRSDRCILTHEFSAGLYWFVVCKLRRRHQKEIEKLISPSSSPSLSQQQQQQPSAILEGLARSLVLKHCGTKQSEKKPIASGGTEEACDKVSKVVASLFSGHTEDEQHMDSNEIRTVERANQPSVLQEETNTIVTDALSIVRAAHNLEVGVVPKTTTVRWKAEHEFEIRYFK